MKINPERLGGGAMGEPIRCDCGDSECASCGTARGDDGDVIIHRDKEEAH